MFLFIFIDNNLFIIILITNNRYKVNISNPYKDITVAKLLWLLLRSS